MTTHQQLRDRLQELRFETAGHVDLIDPLNALESAISATRLDDAEAIERGRVIRGGMLDTDAFPICADKKLIRVHPSGMGLHVGKYRGSHPEQIELWGEDGISFIPTSALPEDLLRCFPDSAAFQVCKLHNDTATRAARMTAEVNEVAAKFRSNFDRLMGEYNSLKADYELQSRRLVKFEQENEHLRQRLAKLEGKK